MPNTNYPKPLMTHDEAKAAINYLFDCITSVTWDNSYERKEYIVESFNNEWHQLFGEENHFSMNCENYSYE